MKTILLLLLLTLLVFAQPGDPIFEIRIGGLNRRYLVHAPSGYDGKTPLPLVVMLHGGGGTARFAAYETGWREKADKSGFLVVFPEALARDPSRPSNFRKNPQLWNDGSDRFYPGQKAPDDVAFLDALLDDVQARFAVDSRRIYVTGFSNGASMSFRYAAEAFRRVAAVAPVAGACWLESVQLERPVPMCYITGTADPLNLIEGGVPRLANGAIDSIRAKPKPAVRVSIQRWTRALGCPAEPKKVTSENGIFTEVYGPGEGGAEVVYTRVEGLGHTWAGGRSVLPEMLVGPRSERLHATDFIWAFFEKQALSPGDSSPSHSIHWRS